MARPATPPTEEATSLCDLSQTKFLIIGYKAPIQDAKWEYTFREPMSEYWAIWDYLVLCHNKASDGRTVLIAKISKVPPPPKKRSRP